jgi:pimeloyl-ACP methyl ester carboxylesterase
VTVAIPPTRVQVDETGREFPYVVVTHDGASTLGIHFSAFFGDWGDRKEYEAVFKGYFHRLRMLGSCERHNWLFLTDTYGADANGTYYLGERGDLFVERAVDRIIRQVLDETGVPADRCVTLGSSMGATGALSFGLRHGVRGIIAISPHIDLDICAATQGRERHVAFVCPDGDPYSADNRPYTRRIRRLVADHDPTTRLPALFMQACEDDDGVFVEQVLPLCSAWTAAGGTVALDRRPRGGHTSDYATRPLLLDVVATMLDDRAFDVAQYRRPPFAPSVSYRSTLRQIGSRGRALARWRNRLARFRSTSTEK